MRNVDVSVFDVPKSSLFSCWFLYYEEVPNTLYSSEIVLSKVPNNLYSELYDVPILERRSMRGTYT